MVVLPPQSQNANPCLNGSGPFASSIFFGASPKRSRDDFDQVGSLPALAGEHIVRPRQGEQPHLNRLFRVLRCAVRAQGLHDDRLHRGKRVLHAVVQFADQQVLVLGGTLALVERCRQALFRRVHFRQAGPGLVLPLPAHAGPSGPR